MLALPGLLFLFVKIFLYAIVYASVTMMILFFISRWTGSKWANSLMGSKLILGAILIVVYIVIFYKYSFSYWHNPGHGDDARIPFGNGYEVSNIDGASTFLTYDKMYNQVFLKNFKIKKGILCSEISGDNTSNCENCFIVFISKLDKLERFDSAEGYDTYAKQNNLPKRREFVEFFVNYHSYWDSNDTWFLP